MWLAFASSVPIINLALQQFAMRHQRPVFGAKVMRQVRQTLPKTIGGNTGARQGFVIDKICQRPCDSQSIFFDPVRHVFPLDSPIYSAV